MKIRNVRVKRGTECGSDHKLLVVDIDFPCQRAPPKIDPEQEDETTDAEGKRGNLLEDEIIKELYKTRLEKS